MKKRVLAFLLVSSMLAMTACGSNTAQESNEAETAAENVSENIEAEDVPAAVDGIEVSNGIFKLTMPAEFDGKFVSETTDDTISIYHKESYDDEFGGLVFTVWAQQMPSDPPNSFYTKFGEMKRNNGIEYSMKIAYPTDVQWNYEKYEDVPEDYKKMFDAADSIIKTITAIDGTFEYGAGTKGDEIFGDVLNTYITSVDEGWDANKYEENDMSPEIFAMASEGGLDSIGYAFVDINADGIEDLVIGDLRDNELKGAIYDIWTVVDGKPAHVVSGSPRDYYALSSSVFIVNHASGGANSSEFNAYIVEPNTKELFQQYSLKYDAYENEKEPYFVSYDDDNWESITEDDYNERLNRLAADDIDFKPLSSFK